MKTVLQKGFKFQYRHFGETKIHEGTIEGAYSYQIKEHYRTVWPDYIFYDKKGKEKIRIPDSKFYYSEVIYTTTLEEERRSLFQIIKDKLHSIKEGN